MLPAPDPWVPLMTTGATLAEAARAVRAACAVRTGTGPDTSAGRAVRAAVVAASPFAFQINRN